MKVTLVNYTPKPLQTIAMALYMTRGRIVDIKDIPDKEAKYVFEETTKSKLTGMWEFVNFMFRIDDINRATSHQLVRHRIGTSFMQESMRITDKGEFSYSMPKTIQNNVEALDIYKGNMKDISGKYRELIDMGIPIEDARGVLPQNVYTRMYFGATYRALYGMAEQRMCMQAQRDMRNLMILIKKEVAIVSEQMAKALQPICVHTGNCEFASDFDAKCNLVKYYPKRSIEVHDVENLII